MTSEEEGRRNRGEQEQFQEAIRKRLERTRRNEEESSSFWQTVGVIGTVGWSVALPTAAGVLIGRWLDALLGSGSTFMFFFMLVGLGMGCWVAWRQIEERS
ncbi:MAG: AtpZ/AtpI family protein [bacterium]